jgi:hypothetical protein
MGFSCCDFFDRISLRDVFVGVDETGSLNKRPTPETELEDGFTCEHRIK